MGRVYLLRCYLQCEHNGTWRVPDELLILAAAESTPDMVAFFLDSPRVKLGPLAVNKAIVEAARAEKVINLICLLRKGGGDVNFAGSATERCFTPIQALAAKYEGWAPPMKISAVRTMEVLLKHGAENTFYSTFPPS